MMTFSKAGLAAALLAVFAALPLQSSAALFDDDEARKAIIDLRTKVEAMKNDLNGKVDSKADKTVMLDILNQREQMLQEIANLRGQIEVLANDLSMSQQRQKDLYADLDGRLRKLEPRQVVIDGQEAAVQPAEQSAYDAARLLFTAGDYKAAATSLGEFVKRYPESGYAANAQYWLGNSFYALRDCKSAIAAQQVVVKAYPDSPKASDALLNMATCYSELKDKANTKKTLETLVSKYPDSPSALAAKERLQKK